MDTCWIHWTKSPDSGLPCLSLSFICTVCGAAAAGDASDWWLHLCFCPFSSGTWKVWKWKVSLGDSSLKNKREGWKKNTFLPTALSLSASSDREFPHTLACATRCWFTPTAGASRGDQDPPRMSNKNSTLSLSSGVKTRGEEHKFNRNGEWNNTNVPLLWTFPSLCIMTPISGYLSAEMTSNVCLQNKIKAKLLCL